MPWFIAKRGSKFCVTKGTKEAPGATVTCHPSRAEATAHLRALYKNVPDAKKEKSEAEVSMPLSEMEALKALHDQMLAEQPEGANHDTADCPLCAAEDEGESMADVTYSQEEVDRAVAEAISDLQAELDKVRQSESARALEEAVEAAKQELQAQIDELQTKLDTAVVETEQARAERDKVQADWDAEKAEAEEAQLLASRRESRLAKVKEAACFPDEDLEENADRFVAMSDEDFEARLAEWAALVDRSDDPPRKTALTAARENSSTNNGSMLGELRTLRRALADPTVL